MMFGTMWKTGLYPPLYETRPRIARDAVGGGLVERESPDPCGNRSAIISTNTAQLEMPKFAG